MICNIAKLHGGERSSLSITRLLLHHSTTILMAQQIDAYSSPSLIGPPYLPRNCGHIREGEVNTFMVVAAKSWGLIREGGLCWEWPLKRGTTVLQKYIRWVFNEHLKLLTEGWASNSRLFHTLVPVILHQQITTCRIVSFIWMPHYPWSLVM